MDNQFQIFPFGWLILMRSIIGAFIIFLEYSQYILATAIGLILCVWLDVIFCGIAKRRHWLKIQLEGFADFICFIVAPAVLTLDFSRSPVVWLCTTAFIIAGMWRIARFNVEGLKSGYYEGLPVTYNGYVFPVLALLTYYSAISAAVIFAPCLLILSGLMITRKIRIPEL